MSAVGLTTHVLDAVNGAGAPGVKVDLYRIDGETAALTATAVTRENGRAELTSAAVTEGEYEIVFAVGDYFRACGIKTAEPSFIDDVPVRFVVSDATLHYHVPIIASPWTYSTYRGGLPPRGREMSGLSTHALDLVFGGPAAGLRIDFLRKTGQSFIPVKTLLTNAEGRTDELFLAPSEMAVGTYQLVFHMGDYFRGRGLPPDGRPFFDRVPVRFSIADPASHYHVPVLVAPWGYSTYRGS